MNRDDLYARLGFGRREPVNGANFDADAEEAAEELADRRRAAEKARRSSQFLANYAARLRS